LALNPAPQFGRNGRDLFQGGFNGVAKIINAGGFSAAAMFALAKLNQ
jgi:hypothetical protein